MDMEKEIEALKARVESLEARVRAEDASAREARRQRNSPVKPKSVADVDRMIAVDTCRAVVIPLLASAGSPERRAQILTEEPDVAALLRKLPDVIPGIDDDTRRGMGDLADEATRLGLTWADLGIAPDGQEVGS